jgi:hypothetical protein
MDRRRSVEERPSHEAKCWRRIYLFAQGMAELGGYGLAALGENEVEGRRRPGGVKRPAKFAFNRLHAQRMVGPRFGFAKN